MSSTGMLLILIAIWIVLNANKLGWIMSGRLKLNKGGWAGNSTSGNF